jgi:CheY-like chemotaxis protein
VIRSLERAMADEGKKPLGRILLQQRAVSAADLEKALADRSSAEPLATRLTESGALSELAALKGLSEQAGVPGLDLSQVCIRLADLALLPRQLAFMHRVLPVLVRDERLFVAMAAPGDQAVVDEVQFITGKRVFAYIALSGPLTRVLTAAYDMYERGEAFYVGPSCPAEVRRLAGVADPTPAFGMSATPRAIDPVAGGADAAAEVAAIAGPAAAVEGTLRPESAGAATPSQVVVVDDAMGKMVGADELSYASFGDDDRDNSVVEPLPGAAPTPATAAGMRTLLVVDDEAAIRLLVRRIFGERGFLVVEASAGLEALQVIKERKPDVIVLDAMLPELHGFEIARRVRGSELYGNIPIVMVSAVYRGWRFAEDLRQSYGVDAYLEKPFEISALCAAVETALSRGQVRPDLERISIEAEKKLRAGIAAYRGGDLEKAMDELRAGVQLDPLAYRLHFHLGLLYGKVGRIYDAIGELELALQVNGRQYQAHKNLAVLYQKAGFRHKAVESWERALRAAPDEETRQTVREHLLGLL